MERRSALAVALVVLAAPGTSIAQSTRRAYRIALLDEVSAAGFKETWAAFRDRLRELGYVEDNNIILVARSAEGLPERLPRLVDELLRENVSVIVSPGPAIRVVRMGRRI